MGEVIGGRAVRVLLCQYAERTLLMIALADSVFKVGPGKGAEVLKSSTSKKTTPSCWLEDLVLGSMALAIWRHLDQVLD